MNAYLCPRSSPRQAAAPPRTRLLACAILAALIAATSPASPARAQCPSFPSATAEIATWNLGGLPPVPLAKAPLLADCLADLDAEVVALVEVNPDYLVGEIVAELNDRGLFYRRVLLPQTAQQNIAVLAKVGVTVSNPRLIPGSDDDNSHLRRALAVDVTLGNFDCTLVAVHLKAGRTGSDRQVRDRQLAAIAGFIADCTAGAEKDVIVVGDYNMVRADDAENFAALNPAGYLRYLSDDLAGQVSHISADGGGSLLDGCAVAAEHTGEYVDGSLRIVPLHTDLGLAATAFREQVSDHLPLVASFRIWRDDD